MVDSIRLSASLCIEAQVCNLLGCQINSGWLSVNADILRQALERHANVSLKDSRSEPANDGLMELVRIRVWRIESVSQGIDQIIRGDAVAQFTIAQSVWSAARSQTDCGCAARHRFDECDSKAFARRR